MYSTAPIPPKTSHIISGIFLDLTSNAVAMYSIDINKRTRIVSISTKPYYNYNKTQKSKRSSLTSKFQEVRVDL